jgi:hypothetical protein
MALVEPYRKSDHETVIPFLTTSTNQQTELPTDTDLTPSKQTLPNTVPAEPIRQASQNGVDESILNKLSASEQPSTKPNGPNRVFVIGVAGIIFLLVGLNVFLSQEVSTLTSRIVALDSGITTPATQTLSSDSVDSEFLNNQIAIWTQQNLAIESRLTLLESPANRLDLLADDPIAIGFNQPAITSPATTSPAPSENWVINLLTLHNEPAAIEFAQRTTAQGITADVRLEVEGQDQVWRVQMGGFSNRAEAVSFSVQAQKTLGLSSVWIFKAAN